MSEQPSRTSRSLQNVGVGVLYQVVVILLGFATRAVFIAELGVELLGVNTLIVSVLGLLAVADLGVNGAVMYALYQPIKDQDTVQIAATVRYAAVLFRRVAVLIAVAGLALTPYLHYLVSLDEDVPQLELYYLVLLLNTVVAYLMVNRVLLLNADQRNYVVNAYALTFTVIRSLAQIAALLVFGSFLWFLVLQVVLTVLGNAVLYRRVGVLYPYLRTSRAVLAAVRKRWILQSVRAMVVFRLGGLALNNSIPVLVSALIGTLALGYYANYMFVVGSVVMITEVAFSSLTPSVGNLVAGGDKGLGRRVFDEIVLLAVVVHGFAAVALAVLLTDFIELWLGPEFVLGPDVVLAVTLNFYLWGTQMPVWTFRSATGLFRETQLVIVLTAATSVALSFALAPAFGLAGVLFAPVIARLLGIVWYEPRVLVRRHLSGSVAPYYITQVRALTLWSVCACIIAVVVPVAGGGLLVQMILKATAVCVLLPVGVWLTFHRAVAFGDLASRAGSLRRVGKSIPEDD